MLCIALALVFGGASLSRAVDQIQHAPGASAEHQHMMLSELTAELDHADDHHAPQPSDSDPVDHLPGSHHHHGDTGSAMPVAMLSNAAQPASCDGRQGRGADNLPRGTCILGPERPPKSFA